MDESANMKAEDAEKLRKIPLIVKSNALRQKLREKKAEVAELDKLISEMMKNASYNPIPQITLLIIMYEVVYIV